MSSQDWIEFKISHKEDSRAWQLETIKPLLTKLSSRLNLKGNWNQIFEKVRQRNLNTALLVTSNVTHERKSWGGLFNYEIIHTAGSQ